MTPTMWLALLRGLGHVSLALLAGGSLFLLMARRTSDPAVVGWSRRWQSQFLGIAVVYLACSAAAILFQASITVEEQLTQLFHNVELLRAYVLDTWHGRTALAGLVTGSTMLFPALLLAFKLGSNGGDQYFLAALSAIATLTAGIGPLSGHAAADEATHWLVPLHVSHLVGMLLWIGGLPLWIAFALWSAQHSASASPAAARLLHGFSILATVFVAVIVVSGLLLTSTFVESIGDLLGTEYGQLICGKVTLLAGVLLIANHLRRCFLPQLFAVHDPGYARAARSVGVEFLLALLILALASVLGQTTPAVHDRPIWPLPFRFSLAATWPAWPTPLVTTIAAVVTVAAIGLFLAARGRRAAWVRAACVFAAAIGLSVIGRELSVQAFPDTYRQSNVAYQTVSIVAGMHNFRKLCADCHGVG